MIPTQLGDKLLIYARTTKAVTLTVTGIVRKPDGKLDSFGPENFVVNGSGGTTIDGAVNTKTIPSLIDGELVAVNVITDTTGIQRGECFVRAVVASQLSVLVPRMTLFADYICTASPIAFPGTPIVDSLSGEGANISEIIQSSIANYYTVPSNVCVLANVAETYIYVVTAGTPIIITYKITADSQESWRSNIVIDNNPNAHDWYITMYRSGIYINTFEGYTQASLPNIKLFAGDTITVIPSGTSDIETRLSLKQWIAP